MDPYFCDLLFGKLFNISSIIFINNIFGRVTTQSELWFLYKHNYYFGNKETLYGPPYLKVILASIVAFKISLAILQHFVWISKQNYNFSYLQTYFQIFQWLISSLPENSGTSVGIWTNIFSFLYSCKHHTKIS